MKILEIIPDLLLGGAQTLCTSLSKELSNGNDVTLLVFHDEAAAKFSDSNLGNKIHIIKCGKKNGLDFRFIRKLRLLIKKNKPDVIHTHMDSIGYVLLLRFCRKIPIFHTVHSLPDHDIKPLFFHLLKFRIHQRTWHITLVGISSEISKETCLLYHSKKVLCIPNGISTRPISSNDHFSEEKYDFVTCGRQDKVKRLDVLIKALSLQKNNQTTLLLIGTGTETDALKLLVSSLLLDSRVFFAGPVTNPLPLYLQSFCFILTSSYEGFPMTILESMNCGLPVIAPRVGGVPDIVIDQENGLLFDVASQPGDIAKLMDDVVNKRPYFLAMGQRNVEKAKLYDISHCADSYLLAFRKAVERSGHNDKC